MDISQRYISAYIVECLTGYQGTFPEYVDLIKTARPRNLMLKGVVELSKTNPRSRRTQRAVRKFVKAFIKDDKIDETEEKSQAFANVIKMVGNNKTNE